MPFKLEGATEPGLCNEKPSKPPDDVKLCITCKNACKEVQKCEKCDGGCYCSENCKNFHAHFGDHKVICASIQHLEEKQMANRLSQLPLREKNQVPVKRKLVSLVGEKPIVNCLLNGEKAEALWDTGAMVSMVDRTWLDSHFPAEKVESLEDFLAGDTLHLLAANNRKVALDGVVTLSFQIGDISLPVPFVVSQDPVSQPIIGYNVIKHLIFEGGEESGQLLRMSCPTILEANISAIVQLIRDEVPKEEFVISAGQNVIPANSRFKVKCRTKYRASEPIESVLFTPNVLENELELTETVTRAKLGRGYVHVVVVNPTNNPLVLEKGVVLGSIEAVSAVIPLMPSDLTSESGVESAEVLSLSTQEPVDTKEQVSSSLHEEQGAKGESCRPSLPNVDLTHLPEEQRKMVEQVLSKY